MTEVSAASITNDLILCPLESAQLFWSDGTLYTDNVLTIDANGIVKVQGNLGLADQVKIRITTTGGKILESNLFTVAVIDCLNLLNNPLILSTG